MKFTLTEDHSIEPSCSHFGICGGCKAQHISYDQQLFQKEAFIRSCFGSESPIAPIIACDPPWRYRNKMEYSFSQARNGEKFLGLMKRKRRVENLVECYLTSPWFIETLVHVREWWLSHSLDAYHPPTNTGLLRTLTLREGFYTHEKMAILTVSEETFEGEELETFIETFPEIDALLLRRQIIQPKIPTRFEETVLKGKDHISEHLHDQSGKPYQFFIRANSFFQPNTRQAETIYQTALELAQLQQEDVVLDLYCGTGTLGIFAAPYVQKVVGIESVSEAIEDGKKNLVSNAITNMELILGDVAQKLPELLVSPSIVFVDPPRAGLGSQTIQHLLKLNPKKILYISCNPETQAIDCAELKQRYRITRVQPVDQFPQTPHMENIILLES